MPAARRTFCVFEPQNALLSVGTCFALLHVFWVSIMLIMHSSLVCYDKTTYESIRSHDATPAPTCGALLCGGVACTNAQNALCGNEPPDSHVEETQPQPGAHVV